MSKFPTPCFVCVEDADVRNELIRWAASIGYIALDIPKEEIYGRNVICDGQCVGAVQDPAAFHYNDPYIDCGTNVELFKALAAMNDENDREQWFMDTADDFCVCSSDHWEDEWCKENFQTYYCHWRKATAEEIIEHFKDCEREKIQDTQGIDAPRWRNPRIELPEEDACVLCRVEGCKHTEYLVLNWYRERWFFYIPYSPSNCFDSENDSWREFNGEVVAWRPIVK